MGAQKRKRSDRADDRQIGNAGTRTVYKTYKTGKEIQTAVEFGSKESLNAINHQIRIPHSQQPVAITHPNVVLVQHYLALSPRLDEVFHVWKIAAERKDDSVMNAAVQLLTSIIALLTPLPYFRPLLMTIAGRVLDVGEAYSNYRDHAQLGMGLTTALAYVDPSMISSLSTTSITASNRGSDSSAHVTRLTLKVWTTLADGGCLKALPKLLSMRRKGGFAIDSDPLDRPDIRHLTVHFLLAYLSHPLFLAASKQLIPPLFANMKDDPPLTLYRIFQALWNNLNASGSPGVNRRTAVALLTEQSIEGILRLYGRDNREEATVRTGNTTPAEMAHEFLLKTCTKPGVGICFPDQGWYKRKGKAKLAELLTGTDGEAAGLGFDDEEEQEGRKEAGIFGIGMVHNKVLGNVVRKVGPKTVDDARMAQLVEQVLRACPELVAGYWPHSGLSVEPRLNAKWLATIAFLGKITLLPIPDESTFYLPSALVAETTSTPEHIPKATPPSVATMIEAILPAPLTKAHLTKGLSQPVGLLQHQTALALARCLRKLTHVQKLLAKIAADAHEDVAGSEREKENLWTRRSRELEIEARKRVPEVGVIIAFAQRSAASQALQASLEEEDTSAKAKSELLTESALRLFGLYYQALPTMAAEFKFDVGKLLVSSSSAKAEAQARKAAREGSVVDDTGSIASVGTTGTAGMGGGFGQARGDVQAFDALSQIHVLELLANVKEWDWTGKAAGSAYTYLYHVLQLYLATPHANTRSITEILLHRVLGKSIMFDHDASELALWLEMLPRTLKPETKPSPTTVIERLQLLSFLDDCVRRCSKTPYRYLEDMTAFFTDAGKLPSATQELPSPLLFTVLEQLQAKLAGHHIAAAAGQVIIDYVSLVILALVRKASGVQSALLLAERLESCIAQAETKRESTLPALRETCTELIHRINFIAGGRPQDSSELPEIYVEGEDKGEILRRQLLKARISNSAFRHELLNMRESEASEYARVIPFEITFGNTEWQNDSSISFLKSHYLEHGDLSKIPGYCTSLLQCLAQDLSESNEQRTNTLLDTITTALSTLRGSVDNAAFELAKQRVFRAESLMNILISPPLNVSIQHKPSHVHDVTLVRPILNRVHEVLSEESSQKDKRVQNLTTRWVAFFDPSLAELALSRFISSTNKASTDDKKVASKLLQRVNTPGPILRTLGSIVQLNLHSIATKSLRRWAPGRKHTSRFTGDDLESWWSRLNAQETSPESPSTADTISLASASEGVIELYTLAAEISPSIRSRLSSQLANLDWTTDQVERMVPLIAACSQADGALSSFGTEFWKATAGSAFEHGIGASVTLVRNYLESSDADRETIFAFVTHLLVQRKFKPTTENLELFNDLMANGTADGQIEQGKLVDACIHSLVRQLSNQQIMASETLSLVSAFGKTLDLVQPEAINAYMAEPILTNIVQDRLGQQEAVNFACTLVNKADFKTSVIRQHLQLLLFHPELDKLLTNDPAGLHRSNVAAYAKALFQASAYVACQPSFMEPLLAIFQASQSSADRDIMEIMQIFEKQRKASITALLKLWKGPGAQTAITSDTIGLEHIKRLDPQKVFATCLTFESRQAAFHTEQRLGGFYDVTFILSLAALAFREGNLNGLDMVDILRSNVLGLASCGLASKKGAIRSLSAKVLACAIVVIQRVAFQEKVVVTRILRLLRHGVQPSDDTSKSNAPSRIPFIMAVFFAHALRSTADPSSFLYPLVSRFLLQRPTLDFNDVPMLYNMLYAAGQGSKKERRWMARFIRDGVRSRADWRILQRRHTFALLASIYESSKDLILQQTILQAVSAMLKIDDAVIQLTEREGLLTWLYTNLESSTISAESHQAIVQLLEDVALILNRKEERRRAKVLALPEGDTSSVYMPRRWVAELSPCVELVSKQSDLPRLRTLSETILRVALANPELDTTTTVTALTSRLRRLDSAVDLTRDSDWEATVQALCRCGLLWTDAVDTSRAVAVMHKLTARMMALDSPLTRWLVNEWKASRKA
ncbi:hypothetical protein QFC21_000538 [Naganishia friedmannii]|uniref:Uncharacterized protein n=1 Tax=Naganishia friedmannii TaxID=89922 RepID=A0ACC2WBU9_9TREE|nr:hypothetical protein QFC21_000538 [Naganishia friedmannii]